MAFGLNRAELIGRLGADVTINHLTSGGRVANISIATDEGYVDKQTGERVDKTEWHRVVTFQPGLVDMFEKHAKKGRLVYVAGKLQTRRWKKDEENSERFSTEILLAPGGRVQFLDKVNGNGNGNGAHPETAAVAASRRCSRGRHSILIPTRAGASAPALFFALYPEEVRHAPFSVSRSRNRGGARLARRGRLPPLSAAGQKAGPLLGRRRSRTARPDARSSSACTARACRASGPTRPPESTETCST